MIYILIALNFVMAYGLVAAIRKLREVRSRLPETERQVEELRLRNAQLLVQMCDVKNAATDTEKYYRLLFNRTDDMVFVHGVTAAGGPGNFIEVNDVMCQRLGITRDEFLEITPLDIEANDDMMPSLGYSSGGGGNTAHGEYLAKYIESALAHTGRRRVADALKLGYVESQGAFRTKGGETIPVEMSVRKLELDGIPVIMCTAHDLTAREQSERTLHEIQQRFEDLFNLSEFGVAVYDSHRNFIKGNAACLRMLGFLDQDQMAQFSLFDNPFLPTHVRERLKTGQNMRYEMVVNFDQAVKDSVCVSVRKDKGHFKVSMNNMGFGRDRKHRGFFAQLEDVTQYRIVEEQLRQFESVGADGKKGDALIRRGITGSLRDMGLADIIQVLCAGGRSADIRVTREKDEARLVIKDGNIIHCNTNTMVGPDAFYELMRWHDGDFVATQCEKFPEPTITASAMSLLMEGARRADEAQ